ncbi:hypothetical protein D3C74_503620 [compost metagenome]
MPSFSFFAESLASDSSFAVAPSVFTVTFPFLVVVLPAVEFTVEDTAGESTILLAP